MFSDGAIPNALNLITGYKDSFDTHGQLQRKLDRKTFLDDAFKFERLLKCDNSCDGVFEKNVLKKAIQVEIDLRRNERILDTSFCNKCPKPDCFPDRNIVKQCDVRCDQCGTAYYESKVISEISQSNLDCVICIDGFVMGEITTKLRCSHIFYADCLMPWLMYNGVCPICQRKI